MGEREEKAIAHMNSRHHEIVIAFCEKFGSIKNPTNVKLVAIDENGMKINCDQGEVFAPFLQKVSSDSTGYQESIITLYNSIDVGNKLDNISSDMVDFIDELKSVVISSVHDNMQCVSSYAPFIREEEDIFICLSQVAEHYSSIKANPDKISLLFLEDEKDAKTIFARTRLSVKCSAEFVEDEKKRDFILDKFLEKNPKESAIKQLKNMKDFHVVKITLKDGRYVKGFGAAYDSKGLTLTSPAGEKNPHQQKNPHR